MRRSTTSVILGLPVAVWLAAAAFAAATATVAAQERSLTLLITSGLAGRLVSEDDSTTVAIVAAALRAEARSARSSGSTVIALDLGRTLGPYAESRWDGGRTILEVLGAAGVAAFAPDAMDLTLGPGPLSELSSEMNQRFLVPASIAGSGLEGLLLLPAGEDLDLRLRVISDPRHDNNYRAAGFDPADPEEANPGSGLADASAHKTAPLEVAILRSYGTGSSVMTRPLTWGLLENPGELDLLIDPDLGTDLSVHKLGESGSVYLVGRTRDREDPWSLARIDLSLTLEGRSWQIDQLELRDVPLEGLREDVVTEARIRQKMVDFQGDLRSPLPQGAPQEVETLRFFVLEAMRESMSTEVAILNRGALRPIAHRFGPGDPLTREAVFRLLSLQQDLLAVRLTGSELEDLVGESSRRRRADGSERSSSLLMLGVDDAGLLVNGRPLEPDDEYTVATNSYLLGGGDDYRILLQAGEALESSSVGPRTDLRDDVVLPRLESAEPFVDLERKGLWRWGMDRFEISFSGIETAHDDAYNESTDSRARAEDSESSRVDLELRADLLKPNWAFENRLRSRYGLIDTIDGSNETDDRFELDSSFIATRIPLLQGRPYLGALWSTEIRPNRDRFGQEMPRRFEQTISGGLRWSARHWPHIRAGLGHRSYSGIDRQAQLGLFAEANFVIDPSGRRPGVRGRLQTESLRSSRSDLERFDLELRGIFPLVGNLSLSPGLDFSLLYESERPGAARYVGLSLGFAYRWRGKLQLR